MVYVDYVLMISEQLFSKVCIMKTQKSLILHCWKAQNSFDVTGYFVYVRLMSFWVNGYGRHAGLIGLHKTFE